MLRDMNGNRKAIRFSALALVVLFGGCLVALFSPRLQVAIVAASFVGYVACTRRALSLCRADEVVFEPQHANAVDEAAREAIRAGLLTGSAGALSLGRSMNAAPGAARSGSDRRRRPAFPRPLAGTR
jgi:hypothetical protein